VWPASRNEARLLGSAVTKTIFTFLYLRLMWSITSWSSGLQWPVQIIVSAPAAARASAVEAARSPLFRPARMTAFVSCGWWLWWRVWVYMSFPGPVRGRGGLCLRRGFGR